MTSLLQVYNTSAAGNSSIRQIHPLMKVKNLNKLKVTFRGNTATSLLNSYSQTHANDENITNRYFFPEVYFFQTYSSVSHGQCIRRPYGERFTPNIGSQVLLRVFTFFLIFLVNKTDSVDLWAPTFWRCKSFVAQLALKSSSVSGNDDVFNTDTRCQRYVQEFIRSTIDSDVFCSDQHLMAGKLIEMIPLSLCGQKHFETNIFISQTI